MNILFKTVIIVVASVLLFTGCASLPKSSTFIPKPEILKESPNDDDTMYFVNKNIDFNNYDNVIVYYPNMSRQLFIKSNSL